MRCERTSLTNTVISAYKMRKSVGKIFSIVHKNIKFRLFYSLDFLSLSPETMLRAVFKLDQIIYIICHPYGIKFKTFFVGGRSAIGAHSHRHSVLALKKQNY